MLVKYRNVLAELEPTLKFVTISEIQGKVSSWWLESLSQPAADERVAQTLALWRLIAEEYLPLTVNELIERVFDVAAVSVDGHYYLLYGVARNAFEASFYLGGDSNRLSGRSPADLGWESMPDGMKNFYCALHDGFFEFGQYRLGPLPVRMMPKVNDGIAVFSSGSGAYIALDPTIAGSHDKDIETRNLAVLQLHSAEPETVEFWPVIDQWTQLGLTT